MIRWQGVRIRNRPGYQPIAAGSLPPLLEAALATPKPDPKGNRQQRRAWAKQHPEQQPEAETE